MIIEASNVEGGGFVLLQYLLDELHKRKIEYNCLSSKTVNGDENVFLVPKIRSPFSRKRAKILRDKICGSDAKCLLNFGNIPQRNTFPGLSVFTYFHNAMIIPENRPMGLRLRDRLRLHILGIAVRKYSSNTNKWIVQTNHVKSQLMNWLALRQEDVLVLPFYFLPEIDVGEGSVCDVDFYYSSGYMPHKNHANLLTAIGSVCESGFKPSVKLTIDESKVGCLKRYLAQVREKGAIVHCVGEVSHQESLKLCGEAQAVIFPSVVESMGLGLIEAAHMKRPILASNLPWIKEVVRTPYSFDPTSADSISRTMVNYLSLAASERIAAERIIGNQINALCQVLGGKLF
jgi:glycosyltransferase involved in cell wall biosynthesis